MSSAAPNTAWVCGHHLHHSIVILGSDHTFYWYCHRSRTIAEHATIRFSYDLPHAWRCHINSISQVHADEADRLVGGDRRSCPVCHKAHKSTALVFDYTVPVSNKLSEAWTYVRDELLRAGASKNEVRSALLPSRRDLAPPVNAETVRATEAQQTLDRATDAPTATVLTHPPTTSGSITTSLSPSIAAPSGQLGSNEHTLPNLAGQEELESELLFLFPPEKSYEEAVAGWENRFDEYHAL